MYVFVFLSAMFYSVQQLPVVGSAVDSCTEKFCQVVFSCYEKKNFKYKYKKKNARYKNKK